MALRASDFVYLYTNPAFHHQTGLGPVCGKRVSEVIYKPNTVEDLCEAVAQLAKTTVTKPAEAA